MTKRVMHGRAVDTAFAKAFNLLGKMCPRELRDKMEEMGYKPGTGLFKELLKSRGKSRFRDGGLAEAIRKVKAKEMQGGGEAKSGGKAVSINTPTGRRKMAEIRKIMPGASVDEVKEFGLKAGILKMKDGGGVTKGKSIKAKISKKGVPAQSGKPLAKGQKIIMIDDIPITSKKEGGEAVPAKFKGFSKLPEEVQKKMDPALAERFEDGGPVKMGSGGGVCKGMGIARAGGKFKVR